MVISLGISLYNLKILYFDKKVRVVFLAVFRKCIFYIFLNLHRTNLHLPFLVIMTTKYPYAENSFTKNLFGIQNSQLPEKYNSLLGPKNSNLTHFVLIRNTRLPRRRGGDWTHIEFCRLF